MSMPALFAALIGLSNALLDFYSKESDQYGAGVSGLHLRKVIEENLGLLSQEARPVLTEMLSLTSSLAGAVEAQLENTMRRSQ